MKKISGGTGCTEQNGRNIDGRRILLVQDIDDDTRADSKAAGVEQAVGQGGRMPL